MSVHGRAVRNCPWTVALWSRYLLAMERHGVDHQVMAGANSVLWADLRASRPESEAQSLSRPSRGVAVGWRAAVPGRAPSGRHADVVLAPESFLTKG